MVREEMVLNLDLAPLLTDAKVDIVSACFAETAGRYLLEIEPARLSDAISMLKSAGIPHTPIGSFTKHDRFVLKHSVDEPIEKLRKAWQGTIDWS